MQKGHQLVFACIQCQNSVSFSVLNTEGNNKTTFCRHCEKRYTFSSKSLWEKLRKFEALCRQIHDSEEILGDTAVAIDVKGHHVKVPYRLLLTRLSSLLQLQINNQTIEIAFRLEPLTDVPEAAQTPDLALQQIAKE